MYSVHCSVDVDGKHTLVVHCTLYSIIIQCICKVYSVKGTVYSIQYYNTMLCCTLYNVECTVYSIKCTLYSVSCSVDVDGKHTLVVHCTVYSIIIQCYAVHCIM